MWIDEEGFTTSPVNSTGVRADGETIGLTSNQARAVLAQAGADHPG